MARKLPRREYLELEAQPALIIEYTLELKTHMKKRILISKLINRDPKGRDNQIISEIKRQKIGERKYGVKLERVGVVCSLINNFTASAKG